MNQIIAVKQTSGEPEVPVIYHETLLLLQHNHKGAIVPTLTRKPWKISEFLRIRWESRFQDKLSPGQNQDPFGSHSPALPRWSGSLQRPIKMIPGFATGHHGLMSWVDSQSQGFSWDPTKCSQELGMCCCGSRRQEGWRDAWWIKIYEKFKNVSSEPQHPYRSQL